MTADLPAGPIFPMCAWAWPRRAKMPPSPWLSMRVTNPTYLMVTTTVSDQKMRDMTPRMLVGEMAMAWVPWKHSLTA